ncbi:MAG TPA: DUF3386 family protein, partial [Pirellulales bacterium]|nr:DUF3386 family protein [Pirellulales bacterium]
VLVALSTVGSAQAHFLWIDGSKPAEASGAERQFSFYFGELPEPGEPRLIGRIAQTRAWIRNADGATEELKLIGPADEKSAALTATVQQAKPASVDATCDYGLYERGGAAVLLQYYARHLAGDWLSHADKLARADRLALDVVPTIQGNELVLQVLYQGQPAEKGEVIVFDPAGEEHRLTADHEGRARTQLTAGRYAVRAAHIEPDRAGERNGKRYSQTWHYCTLTLDAKPAMVGATMGPAAGEVPAAELLRRARTARSVWHDFPGFAAELDVVGSDGRVAATAVVAADGSVSLDMPRSALADWVEEQLTSLAQHRMPDGEVSEGQVRYADDDRAHPLGRKIDLDDGVTHSAYRIQGDVIREVNRSAGDMRFTISVLEIERNAEGQYLPRSFTMNFFNAASGELKTGLGYWNRWQRVGRFDLPKVILEIDAHRGGASARQITFNNLRLVEP